MSRCIQLTKGKFAIVDDEDYERVNKFKWCAHLHHNKKSYYAERKNINKTMAMHRFIMNCEKGLVVDHINHNTLDNRKENLRICTVGENNKNRYSQINSSSKYLGVHYIKNDNRWMVQIRINNKQEYLGIYKTEKEAAIVYNNAAIIHHGEFANLNII